MDKFDLFDLVYMQDNQQFLNEYLLCTLIASPVNNNKMIKNQQNTIITKTIKLLNHSAKKRY